MDKIHEKWRHVIGSAEARFEIVRVAKEAGIRVRGINTSSDIEDKFFLQHASAIERNKDWARNISDFEKENPSRRYLVYGGALHGDGLEEGYGFDTMLGIPEIDAANEDGDPVITAEDGRQYDYQVRLPETGYEGVGIPGESFIHFERTLARILGFYTEKTSENPLFQPTADVLISAKNALENNDYQRLSESQREFHATLNQLGEKVQTDEIKDYELARFEWAERIVSFSLNRLSPQQAPSHEPSSLSKG